MGDPTTVCPSCGAEHDTPELLELEAQLAELREAYAEAIEQIEDWGGYAADYFQEKHDLAGTVARHKAILNPPDTKEDG